MLEQLPYILEAIMFVAAEPISLEQIQETLDISPLEIARAIEILAKEYDTKNSGLYLKRFGDYIQLASRKDYAPFVEKVLQPLQKRSLSNSALETLALVAYKQPITKAEIEAIRGVKCDSILQSLMKKRLIVEVGRKKTIGRAILFGTTDEFLSHFDLKSLKELPPIKELEDSSELIHES